MWKALIIVVLVLFLVPEGHSASVLVAQNVILHNQYGQLTTKPPNQQYGNFTLYANGTMFFDYRTWEGPVNIFSFTAQSYGNGTLQLRFKGIQPTQVTQSATTSAYSVQNGWQQLTYTASQTSPLIIVFGAGPSFPGFGGLGLAFVIGFILILLFIIVSQVTRKAKDENRDLRKFIDKGPAGNQPSTNCFI